MQVVGCFLEHEKKFLILKRFVSSTNDFKWDIPAGKVTDNESSDDAIKRVVSDEVSKEIDFSGIKPVGTYDFVSTGNSKYKMTAYRLNIETKPLNTNKESEWVSLDELLRKPDLIKNFEELIKLVGL